MAICCRGRTVSLQLAPPDQHRKRKRDETGSVQAGMVGSATQEHPASDVTFVCLCAPLAEDLITEVSQRVSADKVGLSHVSAMACLSRGNVRDQVLL